MSLAVHITSEISVEVLVWGQRFALNIGPCHIWQSQTLLDKYAKCDESNIKHFQQTALAAYSWIIDCLHVYWQDVSWYTPPAHVIIIVIGE